MIVVFVDRDGTINEDPSYFGREDDWMKRLRIYDGVAEGIKLLNVHQIPVIVISNQAGVARGYFEEERVIEVNQEINERLLGQDALVFDWYYSPFVDQKYLDKHNLKPEDVNQTYLIEDAETRKPRIGMIREAMGDYGFGNARRIYIVGDSYIDGLTALNAEKELGIESSFVLVRNGVNDQEIEMVRGDQDLSFMTRIADNFLEGIEWILSQDSN